MLIDTSVTIAYKCSSCGTFEFFNISLFDLTHVKEYYLKCRCNKCSSTINRDANSKDYSINIPCIGCGNTHSYTISRKDILLKDINIFYCPKTGMQQCFVGNDMSVRKRIDFLEKELDELINMFGYDSYFKNTQVMFDSLNRIHDIAEQENLCCECGNNDIELTLLPDKIQLECKKCPGSKTIMATSNEDLKNTLIEQHIVLSNNFSDYDPETAKPFMRKTDG